MKVRIEDPGTGRGLDLEPWQIALFRPEFVRVRKEPFEKGVPERLEPDCRIHVTDGGKTREYELYGQAVLRDAKNDRTWQFYFGFVLLRWLESA
jgi:hypothetical protein